MKTTMQDLSLINMRLSHPDQSYHDSVAAAKKKRDEKSVSRVLDRVGEKERQKEDAPLAQSPTGIAIARSSLCSEKNCVHVYIRVGGYTRTADAFHHLHNAAGREKCFVIDCW